MAKTKKSAPDFEKALSTLEALVEDLEQGELPLELALKNYEQGIKLARECQLALKQAEQRVKVLMEENNQVLSELGDSEFDENE